MIPIMHHDPRYHCSPQSGQFLHLNPGRISPFPVQPSPAKSGTQWFVNSETVAQHNFGRNNSSYDWILVPDLVLWPHPVLCLDQLFQLEKLQRSLPGLQGKTLSSLTLKPDTINHYALRLWGKTPVQFSVTYNTAGSSSTGHNPLHTWPFYLIKWTNSPFFNRPGEARAVLQTPSSLILSN